MSREILRLGGIARERIEDVLGFRVAVRDDGTVARPARWRRTTRRVPGWRSSTRATSSHGAGAALHDGLRVGVIAPKLPHDLPDATVVGIPADVEEYARSLYRLLRDADARGLDVVLVVPPPEVGIGAAVGDRLRRAAAGAA